MTPPKKVDNESLSLSQERYVETIAALTDQHGQARTSDLAEELAVSLPSVSQAVGRLVSLGLVIRKSGREIRLSAAGQQVAVQLAGREAVLRQFMVDVIALEPAEAARLACRLEHCVDRTFTDRLLQMADFLQRECPWTLKGIRQYILEHEDGQTPSSPPPA